MKAYKQMRGRYEIIYYSVEITEDMKALALDFAKNIILTDNQYSRLLPENVKNSHDVSLQQKIEIQRTYMGKLGELAFAKFLDEKGKQVDIRGMFQIYEGQTNVDNFDFRTRNGMSVYIKTGFRNIHRRLLVNVEQFENLPKDYYVAVKLNAKDVNSQDKLVDWDDITEAYIQGYAQYTYLNEHRQIQDFGEGPAHWLMYDQLMGIDRLLPLF